MTADIFMCLLKNKMLFENLKFFYRSINSPLHQLNDLKTLVHENLWRDFILKIVKLQVFCKISRRLHSTMVPKALCVSVESSYLLSATLWLPTTPTVYKCLWYWFYKLLSKMEGNSASRSLKSTFTEVHILNSYRVVENCIEAVVCILKTWGIE